MHQTPLRIRRDEMEAVGLVLVDFHKNLWKCEKCGYEFQVNMPMPLLVYGESFQIECECRLKFKVIKRRLSTKRLSEIYKEHYRDVVDIGPNEDINDLLQEIFLMKGIEPDELEGG